MKNEIYVDVDEIILGKEEVKSKIGGVIRDVLLISLGWLRDCKLRVYKRVNYWDFGIKVF